ncbi:hypothetical protein CKAN_02755600 [Cinnamomum micranthum f. kanehirae]|uniref:Uncharacterized protein n=1 Tax=Cinnamomum micranthum f. kanehirae TaxID=337451 RepID=A0A3S3RCZ7_9MAGN|nr:hypothetical protein CKAN_02755600 [Cinnamomum micranthum f. kanehirae]
MDKLIAREKDVKKEIDSAIKERARNIEKYLKNTTHVLGGSFPDYYSRRNISRSALRLITQVDELQNESSFDTAVAFDHLSTTCIYYSYSTFIWRIS